MKKKPLKKGDARLLTTLNANPKNPRLISPAQLEKLGKALAEFGDLGGIVLNRRTERLVGGHQRIAAFNSPETKVTITEALKEPDKTGTVAYGHCEVNGTRYAYREVDWPKQKEAAAMIAANRHGGEFNDTALAKLLAELQGAQKPISIDLLGFDKEEMDALLKKLVIPDSNTPVDEEKLGKVSHKCPKCGFSW
jgi:hypothetical protein